MKTSKQLAREIVRIGLGVRTYETTAIFNLVEKIEDIIKKDRATMVSYIEHLRSELGEDHPDGIKQKAV